MTAPPDDLALLATPLDDRLVLLALPDDRAGGLERGAALDGAGVGLADPLLDLEEPTPLDERAGVERAVTPDVPGRDGTTLDVPPDDRDGCGTVRDATPVLPDLDGTARVLPEVLGRDGTTLVLPLTPDRVGGTARVDVDGTARVDVDGTARVDVDG